VSVLWSKLLYRSNKRFRQCTVLLGKPRLSQFLGKPKRSVGIYCLVWTRFKNHLKSIPGVMFCANYCCMRTMRNRSESYRLRQQWYSQGMPTWWECSLRGVRQTRQRRNQGECILPLCCMINRGAWRKTDHMPIDIFLSEHNKTPWSSISQRMRLVQSSQKETSVVLSWNFNLL
jgi:hypothetical protein